MLDVICDLLLNGRTQHGVYLLNTYNRLEIMGFERLEFHFEKTRLFSPYYTHCWFWDEDEDERFSVLRSALAWTNVTLAGKRDSCYSTTSFSENIVVAGTSYQILEVKSFCNRERTKPSPTKVTALIFQWSFPGRILFNNTRKNFKLNLLVVLFLVLKSKAL